MSVYNTRGEYLDQLIKSLRMNIFVLIFTLVCTIIFTYVINMNYFEQNRYKIFVKYSLGFSLPKILKRKLIIDIALYLIVLLCFDIPLIYKAFLLICDIGLNAIVNQKMFGKSMNEVIKGGA